MIKTFRGLLADGGQDKINLKTLKGEIGYRIVKFQMLGYAPGSQEQESIIKVYKISQTTIDNVCDFTDGDLLAAGFYSSDDSPSSSTLIVTFDQEIFNQDVFVTHSEVNGARSCNYYLELEQVKLNENESTMATLQSLRQLAEK